MRLRTIGFIGIIGLMIGLGLFVSRVFLLGAMVGMCGGHMLLHGRNGHAHDAASVKDDEKTKNGCH